jgi:outer membrane protein with beta-barrel domain
MPQKSLFAAILVCLLFSISPVFAQDYERGWIDVNFGTAQSAQGDLTTAAAFPLFRETAALAAAYPKPKRGADFDFGGGYMFTPVLGVGLSISGTAHKDPAGLGISVPHPFFFDSSGTGAGTTEDVLKRSEGAFHIQMAAVPIRAERLVLRIFGGPSYFRVRQDLVEDIRFTQIAPSFSVVNNVTVTGWDGNGEVEGTGWGFHAGADVGVFFSRVVGIGAMLRFSRGNVDLLDPLSETNVELGAGGIQLGGGLRLKF